MPFAFSFCKINLHDFPLFIIPLKMLDLKKEDAIIGRSSVCEEHHYPQGSMQVRLKYRAPATKIVALGWVD